MKNTWKRTIAILLSVLLAFAALPMALAAGGSAGASVTYDLDTEGNLKITGSGPMSSYTTAQPAPWSAQAAQIKQVIISSGVTTVGSYAFYGCSAMIELTLPNGLAKIENNAFEGCSSLRIVTVPNTTSEIGAYAFNNCSKLETISILHTSCNIANAGTTISNTAKIYGYTGSTAETYAKTYGRTFISLNSGSQQVEENPAAVSGNSTGSLDSILKTLTTYLTPAIEMAKKLFSQLLGNLTGGNNSGSTGTTGANGSTAASGDAASMFSGILSSFAAFVTNTLNSMGGSKASDATSTTGTQGTTAAAGTGANAASGLAGLLSGFDFSSLASIFGNLLNSASAAATTTTAAAK